MDHEQLPGGEHHAVKVAFFTIVAPQCRPLVCNNIGTLLKANTSVNGVADSSFMNRLITNMWADSEILAARLIWQDEDPPFPDQVWKD